MMIEVLLVIALESATAPAMTPTQCAPDEVCYPIDPNPPKTIIPPNCFVDPEGNVTCYAADPSDKF